MKKRILQISAGILAALLAASMPLYARYSDSISVINHLATGDVNIRISELEIENGEEVSYQNPRLFFRATGSQKSLGSNVLQSLAGSELMSPLRERRKGFRAFRRN